MPAVSGRVFGDVWRAVQLPLDYSMRPRQVLTQLHANVMLKGNYSAVETVPALGVATMWGFLRGLASRRSVRSYRQRIPRTLCLAVCVFVARADRSICAQNVMVGAPVGFESETYYEFIDTQWGFSYGGPRGQFFLSRGTAVPVLPWAFPPTVHIGWAGQAGRFHYGLNLVAGQGVRRTYEVTVPYLMVMNGYSGYLTDIQSRPFILQTVPFVFWQRMPPPWQRALEQQSVQALELPAAIDVPIAPVDTDDRPVRIVPRKAAEDDPPLQLGVRKR